MPQILQKIKQGEKIEDYETIRLTKEGKLIDVSLKVSPVKDESGSIIGASAIARDITERKKAEKERHESEEKFRIMSIAALDAIIMIDSQGNISFWNESAKRIFGYSYEDISGKNLHMILSPNRYHERYQKGFSNFQRTGKGFALNKTIELVGLRKDGNEFPIELSISPVQLHNQWYAVGIVRDVTDRKKIEGDLKRKIDELERFKKVTVDRELMMIELKKQIAVLEEKIMGGEKN
jgi:PAS domain S-box-containing protein